MNTPAAPDALPPPLNSPDVADEPDGAVPAAPTVTPPEPARDEVLIAAVVGAAVAALVAAGLAWRLWRRARIRRRG